MKPTYQLTENEVDAYLCENVFFCDQKRIDAQRIQKGWCIEPSACKPKYLWTTPDQMSDCHDYCTHGMPDTALEAKRAVVHCIETTAKLGKLGVDQTPENIFEAMTLPEWVLDEPEIFAEIFRN